MGKRRTRRSVKSGGGGGGGGGKLKAEVNLRGKVRDKLTPRFDGSNEQIIFIFIFFFT